MKLQHDSYSCGVVALQNALRCFGKKVSERRIRAHTATKEDVGTTEHGMMNAIIRVGFVGNEMKPTEELSAWELLVERLEDGFPIVLSLDGGKHWATAIGSLGSDRIIVFDPNWTKENKSENGVCIMTKKMLFGRWRQDGDGAFYGISVLRST